MLMPIYSPSLHDNRNVVARLRGWLARLVSEETELLIDINTVCPPKWCPAYLHQPESALRACRATMASVKQLVKTTSTGPSRIGRVFASSGYGVSTELNCWLDWGLIELDADVVGKNSVETGAPWHGEVEVPAGANLVRRTTSITANSSRAPSSSSSSFSVPASSASNTRPTSYAGLEVYKTGCTTGLVRGQINRLKSYLRYSGGGTSGEREFETQEWAVTSRSARHPFSADGDSGALVFDPRGGLVGMVWAGCEASAGMTAASDITYITPIAAIAESIRQVTGYGVRLPGSDTEIDR